MDSKLKNGMKRIKRIMIQLKNCDDAQKKGGFSMKYIFTDMDGTLLHSDKSLPKQLFPLLDELQKRDIHFGIASGRQYYNLYDQFNEYAEHMLFIAENGAVMFEGNNCIYHNDIKYDALIDPVMRIRQLNQAWCVLCGIQNAYIENNDPELLENCRMYYRNLQLVDDVLEAAKQDVICKISVYDAIDSETHTKAYLTGHADQYHMVTSGKHWVDLTNPHVNKGTALAYLKQLKGIDRKDIMAFGDFMNDYEMLQECEESYAPSNAHPEILKLAQYHIAGNDDDGVIQAIKERFQIIIEGDES